MDVIRHVVVHGRVQGVGFRAWAEYTALERRLQGWVRNRRDDEAVEALFIGPSESVAAMIAACSQGPPGSRVDRVDQRDGTADEAALRRRSELFSVLPTV